MCDHCAGSDDGIIADRHPFCDDNTCAYPDFAAYMYRSRVENMSPVGIDIMIQCGQHSIMADERSVTDDDPTLV